MLELNILQNARYAFPNRVPRRGRGLTKKEKSAKIKAEQYLKEKANEKPLSLPILRPDFGGGGDNAKISQEFFHPKNRPAVLALFTFDTEDEEIEFEAIFARLYVIMSIVSSRDHVILEDFRPYCLETHVRFNRLFPWMTDNETFHAVLGMDFSNTWT